MEGMSLPEEDTQHGRFLTFTLGKVSYALEINYVKEIVGIQPITVIPQAPISVKGIINLRGMIIPAIDMRLKFNKEAADNNDRMCIIVIDAQGLSAGLIVDSVSEVVTIDDGNIISLPDYRTGAQTRFIKAIGKVGDDVKLILDCNKLFDTEELTNLLKENSK